MRENHLCRILKAGLFDEKIGKPCFFCEENGFLLQFCSIYGKERKNRWVLRY